MNNNCNIDIAVVAYTIVFGTGILGFLLFQPLVDDASFPRMSVIPITSFQIS